MNNKHEDSEDDTGKWLTTFNDMVTLLLTFLVLILSVSVTDESKLEQAAYSISAIFDMPKLKTNGIRIFTPFVIPVRNKAMIFENKKRELAKRINKAAETTAKATGDKRFVVSEGIMKAKVIKEGVSVRLGEKLLFETGMAGIRKKNYTVLKLLFSMLKKTDSLIRVEGHTDNVPINTPEFPSNWELSNARAVNVVKYFISHGGIPPERFSAAGYANSKPLFPNVSDHNRELNRRVEVILMLKKG